MSKYYNVPLSIQALAADVREQFEGWLNHRMGRFVSTHEIVTADNGRRSVRQIVSDHYLIGVRDSRDHVLGELLASDT